MVSEWMSKVTMLGVPGCHGRPQAVTEGGVVVVHDRVAVVGDALGLVEGVPLEIEEAEKIQVLRVSSCIPPPE